MPEQEGTTTVEVKYSTWEALDKRKDRGDSFDDVIRKLINATGVGVGDIKEPEPGDPYIIGGDVENVEGDEGCMHYDVIVGETCEDDAVAKQDIKYGEDDDDPTTMYYCEKHAPVSE